MLQLYIGQTRCACLRGAQTAPQMTRLAKSSCSGDPISFPLLTLALRSEIIRCDGTLVIYKIAHFKATRRCFLKLI